MFSTALRMLSAISATCLTLIGPAQAQNFGQQRQWNFVGLWYCTVNAQSNDPAGNYGLEVQVQINPNRTLFARGVVIYPQLRNNIQNVEGYGDWIILPAGTEAPHALLKMRMHPQNHAIISWFVGDNGPGRMYNLFQANQQGRSIHVETQCQQTS